MPPEIVDTLNKAVNAGLEDPQVKARLAEWGATALAGSPADFAKFIADETRNGVKLFLRPISRRSNPRLRRGRLISVHYTKRLL